MFSRPGDDPRELGVRAARPALEVKLGGRARAGLVAEASPESPGAARAPAPRARRTAPPRGTARTTPPPRPACPGDRPRACRARTPSGLARRGSAPAGAPSRPARIVPRSAPRRRASSRTSAGEAASTCSNPSRSTACIASWWCPAAASARQEGAAPGLSALAWGAAAVAGASSAAGGSAGFVGSSGRGSSGRGASARADVTRTSLRCACTSTRSSSPRVSVRPSPSSGPRTTTLPSIIPSTSTSRVGSQATSNVVPTTRISNGPACTFHDVASLACTTFARTEPPSSTTRAPSSSTSVTRARVCGASVMRVPSEKRSSFASTPAEIHVPSAPGAALAPTTYVTAGRLGRKANAASAKSAAATSASTTGRRVGGDLRFQPASAPRFAASIVSWGVAVSSEASRTSRPSFWSGLRSIACPLRSRSSARGHAARSW